MDLDGTLIESGQFWVHLDFIRRILPLMQKHQGWRAAWRGMRAGLNEIKTPSSDHTNHTRIVNTLGKHLKLDFKTAERSLIDSVMTVFPKLKKHFGSIDGAKEFVAWARDHYTLTLATNPVWLLELVHLRMRWGGIDPADFASVTTSDRMHACKPTREYFKELLAQENFEPKDCLFVGNERKMDLPATQVGIAVFLVRPEARKLTCIVPPGDHNPGAWRGNYGHLRHFLLSQRDS